eukprot:2350031-Rhodomonas_salina.1
MDMDRVKFVWSSDEITNNATAYWTQVSPHPQPPCETETERQRDSETESRAGCVRAVRWTWTQS